VQEAVVLDPGQRVLVVSDLHLGDGGVADAFGRKDDALRGLLEHARRAADVLVIAGDGFDLAQAWSLERIVAAHRRVLEELSALARELPVYYLEGNHDAPAHSRLGVFGLREVRALDVGPRVRIEHGHAFDEHNPPHDRLAFWGSCAHSLLERTIRSRVRIPMRKHYCWSTRLGHWLFYRVGWCQAQQARLLRRLGRERAARRCLGFVDYWGRSEWGDIHGMLGPVAEFLSSGPYELLICGHAHQAGRIAMPRGTYVNTGSWTYDDATYVTLVGGEARVRDWRSGRSIEDEEYRGILGPYRDRSFFEWWESFYRGWLRYDVAAMQRAARGEPLG